VGSFVFAACATTPPTVGEPGSKVEDSKAERDYQQVLDRFTRHAEIYASLEQGKDTRVFCEATYQGWGFRQARVKRMAIFQVQPPDVVARNLALEQAENAQFYELFFGAHVNNYRFDDFDRPNSIWRIALVTAGRELTPLSIERLGRADLNMRGIYPYMSDFWVAYRIRFAKPAPASASGMPERVLFRIASTLGKAEMSFSTE
jgi:hypothetical protein